MTFSSLKKTAYVKGGLCGLCREFDVGCLLGISLGEIERKEDDSVKDHYQKNGSPCNCYVGTVALSKNTAHIVIEEVDSCI